MCLAGKNCRLETFTWIFTVGGALQGCLLCFPGFWEILAWLEEGWCVLEEGRIGRWSPRAGAAPPSWMWEALSPSDLGFLLCWDQRPEIPTSPSDACLRPPGLRSPDVPLLDGGLLWWLRW